VTVICPLPDSYISDAARDAEAAAELAASRREVKYAGLDGRNMLVPIAFAYMALQSASTRQLLSNLGRMLADTSGESGVTVCQHITALIIRRAQLFLYFLNF